jgi:hypothetical protein
MDKAILNFVRRTFCGGVVEIFFGQKAIFSCSRIIPIKRELERGMWLE